VAVTTKVDEAHQTAANTFANYGTLPSYRAILDVEGADPADIAIVGDERVVGRQIRHLAEIGVTDMNAAPFSVREDPDCQPRTMAFLSQLAKAGL
jgi:hypothetical protein